MKRPLVLALIFLVFGILLEQFCIIPGLLLLLTLLITLCLGIYEGNRSSSKGGLYFLLSLTLLGIFLASWQTHRNVGNLREISGHNVCLVGTVCQEPELRGNTVNYKLKIEKKLLREPYKSPLKGIVLLTVINPIQNYDYGDKLEVRGIPEAPEETGNPGDFSYKNYLEQQGIQLVLKRWQNIGIRKIGIGQVNPVVALCLKTKNHLKSILYKSMEPKDEAILDGILFGSTGLIDQKAKQDFATIGVIHILSVSGYHVGILVAVCSSIAALFGFSPRFRTFLIIFTTLFYAIMTGASPPVMRALIMAWVMVLSGIFRKKYDWSSSLSVAALVILLFNPHSLYNAGFQLSFLATWGIFYLTPVINKMLSPQFPLKNAVSITLSAQIAVFPITSYYFNYFSLASLPANLIIVPIISVIMLIGAVAIGGGILWLPLADIINVTTSFLIRLVLEIANFFAGLSFSTIDVRQPSLLEIVLYYVVLIAVVETVNNDNIKLILKKYWYFHSNKIIITLLMLVVVFLFKWTFFSGYGKLEVTFLNIGQGDCTIIKSPAGKYILVDTGGVQQTGTNKAFDPGEKILLPYLRRMGVRQIDLMVLTHPHADHIEGTEALLKKIKINRVMINDQFRNTPEGDNLVQRLLKNGVQIKKTSEGEKFLFDENIIFEILDTKALEFPGINNSSMVIRLGYKNFHIMLTADAEQVVLDYLAKTKTLIKSDIIKVSHHGSKNALSESFYRAVQPKVAVISVGNNNFGHPSKEVLQEFLKCRVSVLRTDRQGAVIITSNGQSFDYKTGKDMN